MRRLSATLIILTAAFFACSGETPDVKIAVVDESTLHGAIDDARGEVVVVNFWATWCEPCIEELPHFRRLAETYGDSGLRVVAVSFDEVADLESKVVPFVVKRADPFDHYIKREMNGEEYESLVNSFDPEWFGGVPATFVYDREGERRASFEGGLTFEQLDAAVRPYL